MKNDALGDRMKGYYEDRYRIYLTRRTPVIIRLDGNAFHTFTRGLDKPFDADFIAIMQETCKYLCENIQGCVGGYVQSDEISLLLVDYNTLTTDAWFDYNIQKIVSIAAAKAAMYFNYLVEKCANDYDFSRVSGSYRCYYDETAVAISLEKRDLWQNKMFKGTFDARAFNIPKEDVCNYFIWRQKDATRNSIIAAAQAVYSHSELHQKNQSQMQEMLFQKGINWNDYSTVEKRGSFVRRYTSVLRQEDGTRIVRRPWYIDEDMPILTEDRDYIEDLVYIEDDKRG